MTPNFYSLTCGLDTLLAAGCVSVLSKNPTGASLFVTSVSTALIRCFGFDCFDIDKNLKRLPVEPLSVLELGSSGAPLSLSPSPIELPEPDEIQLPDPSSRESIDGCSFSWYI